MTEKENENIPAKGSPDHTLDNLNELQHMKELCAEFQTGYMVYNFETGSLAVSESLEVLFKACLGIDAVTTESIMQNIPTEDKAFIEELFTLPKTNRKRTSGQFRLIQRIKDVRETRFFHVVANYPSGQDEENTVIYLIRETTKETKQIRELQRSIDRSAESDRIKTNFLLNISHNIRTPMNSILGFTELLSTTDPGPARRKEYLQIIKKQSKSLIHLIDNVAEIAKYEIGNLTITKTPVNINLLLNDIIKEVDDLRSGKRKERVTISLNTPSQKGIEIFTDGGRLHQVFIYLVNHSLKFTLEGSIEIGYTVPEENRIEFFVRDSSPALSREELKNVFDQYSILNKNESNRYDDETGLGLSIAKSIIKLLGGRIGVESEEDQGVTFRFSLPCEDIPMQPPSIEEEMSSAHFKWSDKVILIVEDEDVNGLFLEAVFQDTGARTILAKNGQQAVELCKSINKIDLVLMDLKMPVMNGIVATEKIREFNPLIPIIAQTALSLEEDRQNCLLAGCNDVISKPIEVEELLNLVKKYFV